MMEGSARKPKGSGWIPQDYRISGLNTNSSGKTTNAPRFTKQYKLIWLAGVRR